MYKESKLLSKTLNKLSPCEKKNVCKYFKIELVVFSSSIKPLGNHLKVD